MNESMHEVIVCPWCYVLIEVSVQEGICRCSNCDRLITEEDLEYAGNKED